MVFYSISLIEMGGDRMDSETIQEMRIPKPKTVCYGLLNSCENGERIIFLDYDTLSYTDVIIDLEYLLKKYKKHLSNFALFESSMNKFHAVSFSKVSYPLFLKIVRSSKADGEFIKYSEKNDYKASVLRISPKFSIEEEGKKVKDAPTFFRWFPDKLINCTGIISAAHIKAYIKHIHSFRLPEYFEEWKLDKSEKIIFCKYDSASE